jgi:hypothetical protein
MVVSLTEGQQGQGDYDCDCLLVLKAQTPCYMARGMYCVLSDAFSVQPSLLIQNLCSANHYCLLLEMLKFRSSGQISTTAALGTGLIFRIAIARIGIRSE